MKPSRSFLVSLLIVIGGVGCWSDPNAAKMRDLARGDAYKAQKKFNEASIEYSQALQKDPSFSLAYERLGQLHLETGNQLLAWQSYQKAADLAPDNVDLQIQAGGMLLLARRFDDARRMADVVLVKHPDDVRAHVLRANALAGLENLDTAITMLQEAIQMDPSESQLYSNLGSLQATSGQLEEAEKAYRRAVEIAPNDINSYLPLGNFYWASGRPALAEQAYSKAISLAPNNPITHRAIATFFLGSGAIRKAEPPLKFLADNSDDLNHRIALADYYFLVDRPADGVRLLEEVAKNPTYEAAARTRLAGFYFAAGRSAAASTLIDEVLTKYPRNGPALLLRARFLLATGKQEEALVTAMTATEVQPGFIQALYLVGQLHAQNGDYSQATVAFEEILKVNPFATRAQIQLSSLLYGQGDKNQSDDYIRNVLRRVPEDRVNRAMLVRTLIQRGDLDAADTQLKSLLAEYPEAGEARALMGTVFHLRKDYSSARRWYAQALQADPRLIDAQSGLIGLELIGNRPQAALELARKAVAGAPRDSRMRLILADTYRAAGDLAAAEQTLRETIDMDPDAIGAYATLGQLLYDTGRLAEGRMEFEKLAEKRPRSVPAHTMVAAILRREGKTDEAIQRYLRVLKLDPNAAVAANNLSWIYSERGVNLDDAVMLGRAAKKRLPDVVEVTDTLGWAYYRHGQPNMLKLAVPFLKEAVDKRPNDPLFRYHLGAALARAGRTEEARTELSAALKLSADFHGAAETRRILSSLQ